jgi:5'-nucleotidase
LSALIDFVRPLGRVLVVASDSQRSGQSSAITSTQPVRVHNVVKDDDYTLYICSGTPVDCIKLAFDKLCDRKPDLILSGINHGSNTSISILYSGTMGAALEGAVYGIPAIGFSFCNISKDADFSPLKMYVQSMVARALNQEMPDNVCLNVNFPVGTIKGIRICKQAKGHWTEEFLHRKDPSGRSYYWLSGFFINKELENEETDEWAVANGYISIVPCKVDLTAYETFKQLGDWTTVTKQTL